MIAEHAADAEANRQLSGVVYRAMEDPGLFRMLSPKAHGGLQRPVVDCIPVWAAVARIDSARAWKLGDEPDGSRLCGMAVAEGCRPGQKIAQANLAATAALDI